ncbi:IucA/IucC family protein [Halomonas sp. V046]|uniref:IucA/IucC family protein n=1 Tax=Halomonas sp. V046 TaxID=3459611 RepID=UPI0040441FB3
MTLSTPIPTRPGGGDRWAFLPTCPLYRRVEQRVIRQLLQGLLSEGVIVPDTGVVADDNPGGGAAPGARELVLRGQDGDGNAVLYRCRGARKASFGRWRLTASPVIRERAGHGVDQAGTRCHGPLRGEQREARIDDILDELLVEIVPAERLAGLADELHQTLVKDVQSQRLVGAPTAPDLDWDHDAWEGRLGEGHPYHPSYKSRLGFTLEDNASFGPEFQADIHPLWLAIDLDACHRVTSQDITPGAFLRHELGEVTWDRFRRTIVEAGRSPQQMAVIPVHPWQWLHRVLPHFQAELACGMIIALGVGDDRYRAQQSIRTLTNASRPSHAHLKLSLGITNTSTSRILAAHTVRNSAPISDWLHRLSVTDPGLRRQGLVILREVMGVAFDTETLGAARRSAGYGALGAIWRESLHRYLGRGERAIAVNGLTQLSGAGLPMMDGWVRHYGVVAWARQLLKVIVTPLIHLLYAHGIGLEAHGQNMLLIHRDGWPERLALKDFHDGVRFCPSLLAEPDRAPELAPVPASHARVNATSYLITERADEVRDFTYDACFFIALTELCLGLEQHYGLGEDQFWRLAASCVRDYQGEHPELAERFGLFDLFAPRVEIEELTKRRLFGDAERHFVWRDNPLTRFAEAVC